MPSSIPRRSAVSALYSHVRALVLAPTAVGGKVVSVRALRSVLLAIAYYLDAADWSGAFPSMATIAGRAECSVSTARRAVRALEAAGVLAVELGGGRRSNRYRIVRPAQASPVADRAPRSSGPTIPRCSTPPSLKRGRRPAAAPRTGRTVPDDLRPLADALAARGLRAAYALSAGQVAEVRTVLGRAGVGAMVAAAYRAHRATDPARWWSAWLDLWAGLHVPAAAPADPSGVPSMTPVGDAAAGAAACRASLATAGRVRIGGAW